MTKKGLFISVEGNEGAGKSTAVKFIVSYLQKKNIDVLSTREPGGTDIAEKIRHILLDDDQEPMHAETEMLLMFASRMQHVREKITPALEAGRWVLSDRFADASYAYQGGGRGLGADKVMQLKQWLLGDFNPDLTILLDVTPEVADQRLQRRKKLDRIEQEDADFFLRVRNTYLEMASNDKKRFFLIDSTRSIGQVRHDLTVALNGVIEQHG
jgi:dTMP kinase